MKNKIRIGINAWVLRNKNYDGIGYFTIYTTQELCKKCPEWDFYVFVDLKFNETFFDKYQNCKIIKIFPPFRHPLLYVIFLEIFMPLVLQFYSINRFIGMDGMLSLTSRNKQIPVIYDLNFHHFPENLPFKNRIFYNHFFKKYAKKADEIITISQFSKNDINKVYKIEESKIHVVYCGVNNNFKPISHEEQIKIREKYTLGDEYFTSLGTIHPRKNIITLLEAFKAFKINSKSKTKLVLIGKFLWDNQEINEKIKNLNLKNDAIFTGRLSDQETQHILASSKGLIFISLFEGFGIPILEAFGAGVPVICSNTTSLDEIGGEAALKVDPKNIAEIESAIYKIDNDENLRLNLIQKGLNEKRKYSWENTAELMIRAINQSLESKYH
jgi:glycosyltransferase involved in cell wall biosynthesis